MYSLYVPARTSTVSPAAATWAAWLIVFHGAASVPALASLPVVAPYAVAGACAPPAQAAGDRAAASRVRREFGRVFTRISSCPGQGRSMEGPGSGPVFVLSRGRHRRSERRLSTCENFPLSGFPVSDESIRKRVRASSRGDPEEMRLRGGRSRFRYD